MVSEHVPMAVSGQADSIKGLSFEVSLHFHQICAFSWYFSVKLKLLLENTTKFECAEPLIESACPEALKTCFLDKIHMLTSENGRFSMFDTFEKVLSDLNIKWSPKSFLAIL